MFTYSGILIILLFLGSGTSLIILSIFVYRRNQGPLSKIFLLITISCSVWVFFHLLELVSPSSFGTLLWGRLKYVGIVLLPVAWLNFAFQYTGRKKYVSWRNTAFLLVVPVIVLFSLWTNDFHHLFYEEVVVRDLGSITYFSASFGPFFWLNAIFVYLLVITGTFLVLHALLNLHKQYWKQAVVIAIGVLTPLVWNILYVTVIPSELDITPVLFLSASISLAFGLENFHFLDALLIGRETAFKKTSNAIFVLDNDSKIIDLNEAGEELAKEIGFYKNVISKRVGDIFSEKFDFADVCDTKEKTRNEFVLEKNDDQKYFEAHIDPLWENEEAQIGWNIIIRDITERKKAEERKEFLNTLLKQDLSSKYQTIQGYLQLLEEADLSEEYREYLRKSIKVGRDADEILGLAKKLDEIEETEWADENDIVKVLEHVLDDISDLVEREEIEIEKEYSDIMKKVKGDYSLNTLFTQLLVTRIQLGECNNFRVNARVREEDVLVRIEDDGEQLPEDIKNIFTGRAYTGESTGVGGVRYYMLREVARHNNAEINVKDSELGGARFDIHLDKA